MPDLDRIRHPDYIANEAYWRMSLDFMRGGRHVIAPGRAVGQRYERITRGSDPEQEHVRARPDYRVAPTASYLHSHVRESHERYLDRVNRAVHIPFMRSISDIYSSATLKTGPRRGDGEGQQQPWRAYWSDVDLVGTNIDSFIRAALTGALAPGHIFAVTDRPAFDSPASSRAQQLERGDRAYSYLVHPLDVVDWELDDRGRLLWMRIREDDVRPRDPLDDRAEIKNQYRIWYPTHWELWRKNDGQRIEQDDWYIAMAGNHPVGEVPVAILHARKAGYDRRAIGGDSILADILDIDRAVFNLLSLFHEQLYGNVFSLLAVPVQPGETIQDLDVGVHSVLGFNAESGAPLFLSPDSNLLRVFWDAIQQHLAVGRQVANVSRGRAEYSKEERSGVSLSMESEDKHNAIAALAESTEEFDRTLHRHVAAWEGVSDYPRANYSRDVSIGAINSQVNDALQLKNLGLPPGAMVELVKPIVSAILKKHGVPDDAIQRAQQEVDAMRTQPAITPEVGFARDENSPNQV